MCLVAIAWRAHPRYPLIIVANRDEDHGRPAAPAAWWPDASQVFGGRDLRAGGSWLAVSRSGRFAAITNNPRRPPGPQPGPSRGQLVQDFVAGDRPSGRFLDGVQAKADRYPGFCLLVGTRVQVRGIVTPPGSHPGRWTLPAGVSAVSNSPLEQPWPKVHYLEAALAAALADDAVEPGRLFALLERRDPVPGQGSGGDRDDSPAISRLPFIVGEHYGTRASTVITMDAAGSCEVSERRFDSTGRLRGEVSERFDLE
ncbi:MAG: hypothetical protein BroJett010_20740 [Gammaproteobacteria bacterium]|nr:NRDE family protein [Gammaproteobacteria bacterium]GIK35515.1 MAG: hypothetical protein BroJett010_20740 [Gammaproteobacteria bacterium]